MQIDKTLLWVGSELSKRAPSKLPDEEEIFMYMIEVLFGKATFERIKGETEEWNECMQEINCMIYKVIYPEHVIWQWGNIKSVKVNKGLRFLNKASFNISHLYLAMLLAEGADIITTNLDTCIEKAYAAWMREKDCMSLSECENGVYIYEGTHKKSGKIYHIHGCAEYPEDIGGHLDIGKEYFSKSFRNAMKRYMSQGYNLYYLGYDCRDVYDVNVYLSLLRRQIGKFFCSATVVNEKNRKSQTCHIKATLKHFEENKVIQQDATEFLKSLCSETMNYQPKEVEERAKQEVACQKKTDFRWKAYMRQELEKIKEYKDILALYMNQTLGVSIESIDPEIYQRLDEMPDRIKNLYASLIFRYRHNLVSSYGYFAECDNPIYKELQIISASPYNCQNEQIMKIERCVKKIREDYMSALRRKTETIKWENEAEELKKEIDSLLPEEELKRIPQNNYKDNADLYRLRAELQAICLIEAEGIEKVKMDLYRAFIYNNESVNIHGVLNSLQSQSFCYLAFYYKFGKKSYYDKSQKYKTIFKKYKQKNAISLK